VETQNMTLVKLEQLEVFGQKYLISKVENLCLFHVKNVDILNYILKLEQELLRIFWISSQISLWMNGFCVLLSLRFTPRFFLAEKTHNSD